MPYRYYLLYHAPAISTHRPKDHQPGEVNPPRLRPARSPEKLSGKDSRFCRVRNAANHFSDLELSEGAGPRYTVAYLTSFPLLG